MLGILSICASSVFVLRFSSVSDFPTAVSMFFTLFPISILFYSQSFQRLLRLIIRFSKDFPFLGFDDSNHAFSKLLCAPFTFATFASMLSQCSSILDISFLIFCTFAFLDSIANMTCYFFSFAACSKSTLTCPS